MAGQREGRAFVVSGPSSFWPLATWESKRRNLHVHDNKASRYALSIYMCTRYKVAVQHLAGRQSFRHLKIPKVNAAPQSPRRWEPSPFLPPALPPCHSEALVNFVI